ncbi:MAG: DUF4124 domain-containing protein [Gammaproteobacteria bacterium SHHR-1]|uniref:DUF4124 domain-containing protein n=1 Tax=Magnetovirga frankeli TaxID=947516 RepID=UPI001293F019|nr:DUF4124 domain-containing protein [gamma proteobacterium SS-5]
MRFIPLLLLALLAGNLEAAKLYRWVDENGNVFFSDKVPPSEAQHERKQLDDRGMVVESTSRARTPEEIAREQELERRRQELKRLAEEQKQKDELLLSTYQHEDDIIGTRDGKLRAVDARIKILRTSLRYAQERLARLKTRAGAKPNKKAQADIDKLEGQIKRNYGDIIVLERQKQDIRTRYAGELSRYRELKNPRQASPQQSIAETLQESPLVQLDNLLICDGDCDALWQRVEAFVRQNSGTAIEVAGDRVIMAKPPSKDQDIALTASRNQHADGSEEIFLDLQCRDTLAGAERCAGEQAKALLQAFRGLK